MEIDLENMYNDEVIKESVEILEARKEARKFEINLINKLRDLNEDGSPRGIYQGNGKYDPPLNQDQLKKDFELSKALNNAKTYGKIAGPVAGTSSFIKSLGDKTLDLGNNMANIGQNFDQNGIGGGFKNIGKNIASGAGDVGAAAAQSFKDKVTPESNLPSSEQVKNGLSNAWNTINNSLIDPLKQSIPSAPQGNKMLAAAGVAALGVGAAAAIWNYVMKKKQWLNMGCEQVTDPTQKIKCQIHVMKTTINELSQKRSRCKHANDPKTCMEQTAKQLETLNRQLLSLQNQLQSTAKETKVNKIQDHDAEPLPF